MTPEQAAKGLTLLNYMKDKNKDGGSYTDYPDLSTQKIFL
jgi:hypothetical protein